MSSDDELPPRSQRALCSKPTAPVTPIGSESDPDDVEEEEKKVTVTRVSEFNEIG